MKRMPWKAYGSLPDDPALIEKLNRDPQLGRAAGYGANMIDKIIEQENPIYILEQKIYGLLTDTQIKIGGIKRIA